MRDRNRYSSEYYVANRDVVRARQALYRLNLKRSAFAAYGGEQCCLCPESRIGALTIDHINGGGRGHRQSLGGGNVLYRWLKTQNYPPGYRVLCSNCNWLEYLSRLRSALSEHPRAVASRTRIRNLKARVVGSLGGCCKECGCTDHDVLTVHHPGNDGAKHRRSVKENGGWKFYLKIDEATLPALECLCFSCNDAHHAQD